MVFDIREQGARVEPIETGIDAVWQSILVLSREEWVLLGKDGTIGRTSDGGRTWERRDLPPPTQSRWLRDLAGVNRTVFAFGQSAFFRSEDGGATWTEMQRRSRELRSTVVTSWGEIIGLGNRVVVRVGESNLEWTALPGIGHAKQIVEVEPNTLLALSELAILRSEDRGRYWKTVFPEGKPWIMALAALGNGRAVAVGERGVILTSSDGGRTWTPKAAPKKKNLDAVWGQEAQIVAVGGSGTIFVSEDGGEHFFEGKVPPKTPSLFALRKSPRDHVVRCGPRGATSISTLLLLGSTPKALRSRGAPSIQPDLFFRVTNEPKSPRG